jgi:hypothetical protein
MMRPLSTPDKPQATDTTGGVEAVERALRVLDSFEPGDTGLSLKEVADRSGVNKATILRRKARPFTFSAATPAFVFTVSIRTGLRGIMSKKARSFR